MVSASASGDLLAPFNLVQRVVLAYVAAVVIDATGNYRLIWLFPAATGLAHRRGQLYPAQVSGPPTKNASSPDMVTKRLLGVERRPGRIDG